MPGPDTRAAHRTGLPPAGQPSFPQTEVAIAGCLVVPSPPPTSLPPLLALHCCAPHRRRWPTPPVVAQPWYVCENVLAAACCALLAAASAATCRGGVCRGSLCGAALPSPGAFDGAFVFSGTGIRHPAFDGSGTSALTLPSPFPAPAFAIRPSTAPAPRRFDVAFAFSGTGFRHPAFDGSGTSQPLFSVYISAVYRVQPRALLRAQRSRPPPTPSPERPVCGPVAPNALQGRAPFQSHLSLGVPFLHHLASKF